MPECEECGDEYMLDDNCEEDGMCHPCAHNVASGLRSRLKAQIDVHGELMEKHTPHGEQWRHHRDVRDLMREVLSG